MKRHTIKVRELAILFLTVLMLVMLPACTSTPEPVSEPESGTILSGYAPKDGSQITVTLAPTASSVVMLKDNSNRTLISFYVRAGETATVDVPAEKMYVQFASGKNWYGEDNLFGKETIYRKDNELTDFTQYTWEYELDPMSDGEFDHTDDSGDLDNFVENNFGNLDGQWIDVNLKDGSSILNVSALAFTKTVYNCTSMTVNMNVTMNAGTSCKDWQNWGRNGDTFVKIGKIYLPNGDGYVSQTINFASPVTFDAIAVTPTIVGGYSWSLGLSITDVQTK